MSGGPGRRERRAMALAHAERSAVKARCQRVDKVVIRTSGKSLDKLGPGHYSDFRPIGSIDSMKDQRLRVAYRWQQR